MPNTLREITDQQILDGLANDDKKVFDYLFDRYYVEICRHSFRFTGLEEISEEIAQDIFVYLWEKRKEISINTSLKAYLYKAAGNRSLNYIKSQHARQKFEDVDTSFSPLTVSHSSSDSDLNYEELKSIVQKGVASLPDRCRAIFSLSRNAGLTYAEIAKELEISPKTVEVQMGIALKKLREFMGGHWEAVCLFISLFFHPF